MRERSLFGVTNVITVVIGLFFVFKSLSACTNVWATSSEATHPHDQPKHIEAVMEILEKARKSYAQLQDYTAIIHKEEYKDGEKKKDERTIIKFQKPFKVYLKWLSGKNKGSQLLYVEGKYDNKMIIRKGGGLFKVFGTMEMDPDGFWLKKFTKHSIRMWALVGLSKRPMSSSR